MLKLRIIGDVNRDIWLVEPGITIGSGSHCELFLTGKGIQAEHAKIAVSSSGAVLENLCNDAHLLVNGQTIADKKPLKIGDEIALSSVRLIIVDPSKATQEKIEVSSAEWSIKANHSALNNRVYPISGPTVLGRSNECDVVLSVTHLSRKHAELFIEGERLKVRDLESANGTFVNGVKVTEKILKPGDELRLDTLSFTVMGGADEDLDKTSVRSVITPELAAAAMKTKATTNKPKPVTSARKERATAIREQLANGSTQKVAPVKDGFHLVPIILGVVVVLGLAAYFLL